MIRQHALALIGATLAVVAAKTAVVAFLLIDFGSPRGDPARGGALLATAGEFAFVLLPFAAGLGLLARHEQQFVTALAALMILVAPLAAKALEFALARRRAARPELTSNSRRCGPACAPTTSSTRSTS